MCDVLKNLLRKFRPGLAAERFSALAPGSDPGAALEPNLGHNNEKDHLWRTSRFPPGISPGGANEPTTSAQRSLGVAAQFLHNESQIYRAHGGENAGRLLRHSPRRATGGSYVRTADRALGQF